MFNVFFSWYKTKYFWNIPKENYFSQIRILNLFIKSFVNPFVDIALSFYDSSFNLFSFEVTVFSFCLAVKFSDVNLLNS